MGKYIVVVLKQIELKIRNHFFLLIEKHGIPLQTKGKLHGLKWAREEITALVSKSLQFNVLFRREKWNKRNTAKCVVFTIVQGYCASEIEIKCFFYKQFKDLFSVLTKKRFKYSYRVF